ncbi:MAG: energy transducer TonB [Candidatus Eremiobacteraeota bacterium]|nr:energy transducer TonB [Candidatus Eremiobacteraeota bacterium]
MIDSRERTRTFLAYGFGISIAVHLIVLPFVHTQATATQEDRVVDTFRVDMPTPPPRPPSTPTPQPTVPPTQPPHATPPPQHPVQQPPLLIHAPHQDAHPRSGAGEPGNTRTTGDPNGTLTQPGTPGPVAGDVSATPAPPAATPVPTPKPTPTPLSCARPNVAATTLRALEPETPALAQQQGISGIVQVVVSLDAQSRVVGTRIQSSPSAVLNLAALGAARGSQFRTEVKNCEPVAADYVFSVDFTSQ